MGPMRILSFLFLFCSLFAKGPVLMVIGTRPEAIKMAPVYLALQKEGIPVFLLTTGQHRELVENVLRLFEIEPDFTFDIMKKGQDLFYITEEVLKRSKELFSQIHPSLVMVQGDTTSALASALAAFYLQIPIAHVEAGLRSHNRDRPFPEEINRRWITLLSSYHFAPTEKAKNELLLERVDPKTIFVTGNTVVDALHQILERNITPSLDIKEFVEGQERKKLFLLTVHRRESVEEGLFEIFSAIEEALQKYPKLSLIYPIHPNPQIQEALSKTNLQTSKQIYITKPLDYPDLVWLLKRVDGVLTDSGGIQEEACNLGKPTLVLREETDRPEAIEKGLATLVGRCSETILFGIEQILKKPYPESDQTEIYGDGRASVRIAEIIKRIQND